jgi:glutamate synthase domain-containing protein 3
MTNGVAFVLDEGNQFERRHNAEDIGIERLSGEDDDAVLRSIVQRHAETTGSPRAFEILNRWGHYQPMFWKVVPHPARGKQQMTVLAARSHVRAGAPARPS